jgi:DNA-binding transcriptional ArsR family regulator
MTKPRIDPPEDELSDELLDRVFGALSDPVRRRILTRLRGESLLVSELAAPFEISLQAVSRHIQVLEDAGLVQKERTGRISRCSLTLGPIVDAAVWINRYSRHWQEQFELLAASLTELEAGPRTTSASRTVSPRRGGKGERKASSKREPRPHARSTKPR